MKPLSPKARELLLEYRREQKLPPALHATMLQSVEVRLQQGAQPESASCTGTEAGAFSPAPASVLSATIAHSGSLLTLLGLTGALLVAAGGALFATRTAQEPHRQRQEAHATPLRPPVVTQNQAAHDTPSEAVQRASAPALAATAPGPTRRVRRATATASEAKSEARAQDQSPTREPRAAPPHAEPAVLQNSDTSAEHDSPAQAEGAEAAMRVQAASHAADERQPLFDDEVMLLRDANEHLRRAQPLRALSALAEHARRFPRGQLAELRVAVRIQALCALGKEGQAADEATSFLRAHPGSPYAPRVRSGCSQTNASQREP
jgi:hypothetical protein